MHETRLTLATNEHELARRQVMAAAATDLENGAEMVRHLADDTWPVGPQRVEDARATLKLAHESLAAVDSVGWPDVQDLG